MTYYTQKFGLPVKLIKKISLIANANLFTPQTEQNEHYLVIIQQSIDSCVKYLPYKQLFEFLVDCNPLHTFLSKLSDIIKINLFLHSLKTLSSCHILLPFSKL